jgi:hypothetical protein
MQQNEKLPNMPASLYLDQDESGEPRVVSNAPAANDPMARHVRRVLEKL